MMGTELSNRVAFIGTYVPRQCGIATFTNDLAKALSGGATCLTVAVNDQPAGYDYPADVLFTIDQEDLSSYHRAAQYLNINNVDTVSLQHEYGIFGGPVGSHVVSMLELLRTPVVTTLHTVLNNPRDDQREVLAKVAGLSDRIIVMSHTAERFLQEIYGVPAGKIDFIPHGIPDFPFVDPNFYKDKFGVQGKRVLLTFGLLSPFKGLEHAIKALPAIRRQVPHVVYLIVGATHPAHLREEGEAYRLSLQRLARNLEVEDCVIFHNRFVTVQELTEFIGASDVFVTPYLLKEQITSGTLSWALGAGKAVISTPYWYAEELLGDDRGVLVPFESHEAIAEAAVRLFTHEADFHAMRKRAYLFGRDMTWANVAHRYVQAFQQARSQRAARPTTSALALQEKRWQVEFPRIRLHHLKRLTDGTGILRLAQFSVPDYHRGYTTDDNARALILVSLLEELKEVDDVEVEDLAIRYLGFLAFAFDADTGRLRNELDYGRRRWLEAAPSEDCHGRALWALGEVAARTRYAGAQELAGRLFSQALPAALRFSSPRAWAYALLGLNMYLQWFAGDRSACQARIRLAKRLTDLYRANRDDDWCWFEDRLTYSNARLPHALMVTGEAIDDEGMTRDALESLRWLVKVQKADGDHCVPIGTHGYYVRGGERRRFDQQPVEAHATVAACLTAFRLTGQTAWYEEAERAFEWFLGRNDLGEPLVDARTGACRDGLQPDRVNANQSAEATLAYLTSLTEMRLARRVIDSTPAAAKEDHARQST